MRKKSMAVVAAVAGTALSLGGGGTAFASSNGTWSFSTDYAASAYFQADPSGSLTGDTLWVDDDDADGHSAVGVWATSSRSGSVWNSNGSGTRVTDYLELAEEVSISYVACWGESSNKDYVYNCDNSPSYGVS